MGKRQILTYIFTDDMTGKEVPEIRTVRFAFGGAVYEIDLGPDTLEGFVTAMKPYVDSGRRVGKLAGGGGSVITAPSATVRTPANPDQAQRQAMRLWWGENWDKAGLKKPGGPTGRFPDGLEEAYHKAGGLALA